jgi:hypothetical protein
MASVYSRGDGDDDREFLRTSQSDEQLVEVR